MSQHHQQFSQLNPSQQHSQFHVEEYSNAQLRRYQQESNVPQIGINDIAATYYQTLSQKHRQVQQNQNQNQDQYTLREDGQEVYQVAQQIAQPQSSLDTRNHHMNIPDNHIDITIHTMGHEEDDQEEEDEEELSMSTNVKRRKTMNTPTTDDTANGSTEVHLQRSTNTNSSTTNMQPIILNPSTHYHEINPNYLNSNLKVNCKSNNGGNNKDHSTKNTSINERSSNYSLSSTSTTASDEYLRDQVRQSLQYSLSQLAQTLRYLISSTSSGVNTISSNINTNNSNANNRIQKERYHQQQIEKQRQIFTLSFLARTYKPSRELVIPRSDVYDAYVDLCDRMSLKPLSAATLGKLIRLIFPEVESRRLGGRTKSKYHYVGLGIPITASSSFSSSSSSSNARNCEVVRETKSKNVTSDINNNNNNNNNNKNTSDVALFCSKSQSIESSIEKIPKVISSVLIPQNSDSSTTSSSLLSIPTSASAGITTVGTVNVTAVGNSTVMQSGLSSPQLPLRFIPSLIQSLNSQSPQSSDFRIKLNKLRIPKDSLFTEKTVASFTTAYSNHCTEIFNNMRYLHYGRLQAAILKFPNSLSDMERDLYYSEWSLKWVEESDKLTHSLIIKMLAKLALQEIPTQVISVLKEICKTFTQLQISALSTTNNTCPKLIALKSTQSHIFTLLITRLVRVSETAQSAITIFSRAADLQLMRSDWMKYVPCEDIIRKELPTQCYLLADNKREVTIVKILKTDIPYLLDASTIDDYNSPVSTNSHSQILARLAEYISSTLPRLFQSSSPVDKRQISPRTLTLCISVLLTSALREISLAGGAGFGAWWVTRCWVDEWVGWCGELGGFIAEDNKEEEKEEKVHTGHLGIAASTKDHSDGQINRQKATATDAIAPELQQEDVDIDEIAEEDKVGFDSSGPSSPGVVDEQ